MADGATIQVCNEVALQQGVGLTQCLDYVKKARESGLETPVILMGYYNPFRAYGLEKLASDAAACGVDGFIIVDLPPEEAALEGVLEACQKAPALSGLCTLDRTDHHRRTDVLPRGCVEAREVVCCIV